MKNEIPNIFLPEKEREDFSHFFLSSSDYGCYDIKIDDYIEGEDDSPEDDYLDLWEGGAYDFEY